MEQKIEREWTLIVCPDGKGKVSVMFEWDTVTEKDRILKRTLKQIDCHKPKLTEFREQIAIGYARRLSQRGKDRNGL
jgi:hypothetical protein